MSEKEMVDGFKQGEVTLENRIHIMNDEGDIISQPDSKEDWNGIRKSIEDWLPITQSRKGNSWTAIFHLLCSGIGTQTLTLPLAFVYLGWFWGILCLCLLFLWQLYTIGLLVNLHECVPDTRYSRYLQLSTAAFGGKLGNILAIFPVIYLSGGQCVLFIITGGGTMQLFYELLCEDCSSKHPLTTTEWFLVFTCLAILVSLLCPNLHSVSLVSCLGAIMAVGYCTILWIFFVVKGRVDDTVYDPTEVVASEAGRIRSILDALGIIALTFRGHNVVLEIQGTMPSTTNRSATKLMWKGVAASYIIIAMCFLPVAIVGYWTFGNKIPANGGLLKAFSTSFDHRSSKAVLGLVYMQVVISCVTNFQIQSMVIYDNMEHVYAIKKNQKCPKLTSLGLRILFGGLTFFLSATFWFLPRLEPIVDGISLPLTFGYPCLMWIAIKRPPRRSIRWWLNLGLGCLGIGLCVFVVVGAAWNLVCRGLDASFLHPHVRI